MDFNILNTSFIQGIIVSDETKEINLHRVLYWLEFSTSIIGILLNVVLIVHTTKISGKGSYQRPMTAGLCLGRINLWISQLVVCLISIVTCLLSQILEHSTPQSKIWWRSFLNSASVAIFCSNVLTGQCLMSWTHWYSVNVWIPHNQPIANKHLPKSHQLLSPFRMTVAATLILWLSALLCIVWLTLNVSTLYGLTTSELSEDQRCASLYFKLYSMLGLTMTTFLLFLNFTSIPPVSGNLSQKALNIKHRNCRDADCVCSGSGIDLTSESETKINYHSKNVVRSLSHFNDALHIDENDSVIKEETKLELENKDVMQQQKGNNNLSCSPSVDLERRSNARTPSFYSADVSEMSILPDSDIIKPPNNQLNRTNTANRKQRKKMRNSIPNREDSASPMPVKLASTRRRKLKKRARKKLKNVTIQVNKIKNRGQLSLIACYLAMHTPHWFLLACASFALPSLITITMSSYRLWTNLICCLNPVILGLCYPSQPSFRIRKLRAVHPLLSGSTKV